MACVGLSVAVLASMVGSAQAQNPLSSRTGAAATAATRGAVVDRQGAAPVAVDWTRGMILAVGAASGDLRAPSPAIARLTARRQARAQARRRLLARAKALRLDGQPIAARARYDEQVAVRLRDAVDQAIDVAVEYGSDGSIVLTAGLPLEAARLAVVGIPTATTPARDAPTAILVDARGVVNRPALGLGLDVDGTSYTGPTVFYRDIKRARSDARAGERILRVRATGRREARLLVTGKKAGKGGDHQRAAMKAAAGAGALVIIVIGKAR